MFNKLQLETRPAKFLAKANLEGVAARVLIKLMFNINRHNMVLKTPKNIAIPGITFGDFKLGIRILKQHDLIRKYTKREYMLNPDVMFNGDDKQYYITKYMWDTQTTKGLRYEIEKNSDIR